MIFMALSAMVPFFPAQANQDGLMHIIGISAEVRG